MTEETVTRALTGEYIEQGEPTLTGEYHVLRLSDLADAGVKYIAFHYPDDQETPNDVVLYGEES
jgi:hypothetical protein